MKSLIKYPVLVFIILLIGYSQLFAQLYRAYTSYPPVKKAKTSAHYQASGNKATEVEDIYIEEKEREEEEWISLNEYPKDNNHTTFFYTYSPEYFVQHLNSYASFGKRIFCISFFRSSYLTFRVFRL